MTLLSFDGRNLKSIDRGFADQYYTSSSQARNSSVVGGLTANQVYAMVAQAFRCVTMRANEVSRIPRALLDQSGQDVTEQYKDLMLPDDFIYSWESSMCLAGAAYAILDVNPSGYNAKPRWVISNSVDAIFAGHPKTLQYFRRNAELNPKIDPSRMLWWWAKNFEREDEPGPGETQVALGAASSLYAENSMIAAYFNGGAIKVTVFQVPVGTPQQSINDFQNWLGRRLSSVRNAFKNIVMPTADLKPVVIGSDLKDTQAPEISKELRDSIATAHGIPPNVVSGEYKYATADSEYLGWIAGEVIPRTDRMFERLTEQYYSRFGLKLVTQPRKMEIMQTAQLAQITAVTAAVGKPIMLMSEGREYGDLKKNLSVDELKELQMPLPKPIAMTTCPNCGSGNLASGGNCTQCGAPLGQAAMAQAATVGTPVRVHPDSAGAPKPKRVDFGASEQKPKPVKATTIDSVRVIEALKAWRVDELESKKTGKAAVITHHMDKIPNPMRTEVNQAVRKSETVKDIRAVFERAIAEVKATAAPEAEPVSDARYLADALLAAAEALRVE